MRLNDALKIIREVHRLSQTELASALMISNSYLSEVESGKKVVSVDLLQRYANQFDVPASTFLSFAEALDGMSPQKRRNAMRLMKILEWTIDLNDGAGKSK